MIDRYSVSVIFPVYNEESVVVDALTEISSFLKKAFSKWEIIVVESGSTDNSSKLVDSFARENPCLKVFHQKKREGFGSALKLGFAHAEMDLVWVITPDIPFKLEKVFDAIPLLDKYNCVLSYRSEDKRHISRRIMSLGYNTLLKCVFGLKQKHINSAFKLLKLDLLKTLTLRSNGWFIDAELLNELKKRNVKTVEIPVELIDRRKGESTVKFTSVIKILEEMFRYLTNRK
ncbi:MAG: glycosyltransferase family 2 protein [Nitrospinales bacterium]